MPIRILPEETINKIAAGEVIERPANAVKELVENSLDAKSTSIEVEIKGAGRRLIRVLDNGAGIPKEDIKLAVTRHATSKLSDFNDLENICSMGFRGEALPSIAAVSNLLIQSKIRDASEGWEISLSGGKIKNETTWAGAGGTNIEASELFFNTPARDKFLKSDTTERNRIIKIIEELAIAWPEVAFKIISEGKAALETPSAFDPLERISDVLGKDFASTLIHIKINHPFLKINAYITKRENSLSSKNYQFIFVNKRPVNFPKSILHSLYEAYRENLPAGRHPGAVIFLEINPASIDVNIHPAKREVRFSKEQEMHHLIYTSIKEALNKAPASGLSFGKTLSAAPYAAADKISTGGVECNPREASLRAVDIREPASLFSYSEQVRKSGIFSPPKSSKPEQAGFVYNEELAAGKRILGQALSLYIIAQESDGIVIIDQHAAAERIRYEKYLQQWRSRAINLQQLLFPENIELPPSLFITASANINLINAAGWEVSEFGANTIRISSVPAILGNNFSSVNALTIILEALREEKGIPDDDKIEKIIRTACHESIKAGDKVSDAEAFKLYEELLKCAAPNTCPHGRPTMLKISKPELKKHFQR